MDKCPKCGGKVKVLERSLEYWGGVHCIAEEEKFAAPNSAMDAIALSEQYSTTVIQHDKDGVATMRRFRQWVREQQHQ